MSTFKVTLTGANFYALRDAINAASPPAPAHPPMPAILGCTGRGCPIGSPKPASPPDDPTATTPPSNCEVRFAASSDALTWLNHYDGLNALSGISWTGVEES
jgi:hypothetical protein